MADLERYSELRDRITKMRREADKASGALESLLARLKEEFGCKTLEEAEELLKETQDQLAELEQTFNKSLHKFEKKWSDALS
jgi:predicted translin family RNA/ssDNA-binding protein